MPCGSFDLFKCAIDDHVNQLGELQKKKLNQINQHDDRGESSDVSRLG